MQRIDNGPAGGEPTTGRSGMTERAGMLPFASAAAAMIGRGRRKTPEVPASERGFQKISGRKLPSAFSEGMTALPAFENPRPVPMPAAFASGSRDPNRASPTDDNGRTFYRDRDSDGYFTGSGEESGSRGPSPNDLGPPELQPGPARQATVHHGGGYSAAIVNPFETPPPSPRMPMLEGRSVTPMNIGPGYQDPRSETPRSHSSRFMEEV